MLFNMCVVTSVPLLKYYFFFFSSLFTCSSFSVSSAAAPINSAIISCPTSGVVTSSPITNLSNNTSNIPTNNSAVTAAAAMAAASLLSPAALTSLFGDHASVAAVHHHFPRSLSQSCTPIPPPAPTSLFSPPPPPPPHSSSHTGLSCPPHGGHLGPMSPFGLADLPLHHHPHPHDIFLHSDFRPSPSPSGLPGLAGSLPFDARVDLAAAAAAAMASIRHPGNPGAAPAGSLTEPLDFYSQKLKQLAGGTSSASPSPLSPGFTRKPVMTPPSPLSPEDGKLLFKLNSCFVLFLFDLFLLESFLFIPRLLGSYPLNRERGKALSRVQQEIPL